MSCRGWSTSAHRQSVRRRIDAGFVRRTGSAGHPDRSRTIVHIPRHSIFGRGTFRSADFPAGCGVAMRRTELHQAMVDRARETGVTLAWGSRVVGLTADGVALDNRSLQCRWVIGADGSEFESPPLGGLRGNASRIIPFRISAALSRCAVDRVHGNLLGRGRTDVRNACEPIGSVRGAHHRDSHLRMEQALSQFPELSRRLGRGSIDR